MRESWYLFKVKILSISFFHKTWPVCLSGVGGIYSIQHWLFSNQTDIYLYILLFFYAFKLYLFNYFSPMFEGQALIKPRSNDRNMSTQDMATLLGATCCVRLATLLDVLRHVATCWDLKMVKFFMQHLWMLHDVLVIWPGSCNNVTPGHAH